MEVKYHGQQNSPRDSITHHNGPFHVPSVLHSKWNIHPHYFRGLQGALGAIIGPVALTDVARRYTGRVLFRVEEGGQIMERRHVSV